MSIKSISKISVLLLAALLFVPFWKELSLAFIFSEGLRSYRQRWTARFFPHRKTLGTFSFLSLFGTLIGLPVLLGIVQTIYKLSQINLEQLSQRGWIQQLGQVHAQSMLWLNQNLANLGISGFEEGQDLVQSAGLFLGQKILSISGVFLTSVPGLIFHLVVFNLGILFFSTQDGAMDRLVLLVTQKYPQFQKWTGEFQKSCTEAVSTSLIIGFTQAFLVTFGALIWSDVEGLIVFGITFLFSFIPILGAGPVAFVLSLAQFGQGHFTDGVMLLILTCVVGISDNIIRSVLMGKEEDIHPLVAILGVIGAVILIGFPGLFIGPVLISMSAKIYHQI